MTHRSVSARWLRRSILPLVALLFFISLLFPSAQALNQNSYIYIPQTGHYLVGAFRSFWELNGGLEIFGYPITPEYVSSSNGRVIQYFERARFELIERNGQAQVDLGKLGVEVTGDRVFPKVPPITDSAERRYFPQTQHIVQYGFKQIWETRGGERIFGLPISEEIKEVLDNGEWHTVQYFERVRFEYWPTLPPGKRVLISHLGRWLAPPELTPPQPPDRPPGTPSQPNPAPTSPEPAVPTSVNARVTPESGPPGTRFVFDAYGFEPGENVGVWLTAPDQSTYGADFQATADGQGSIAYEQIGVTTSSDFTPGIWSLNAQGVNSKRQAVGYFRIDQARTPGVGDPNKLGQLIHDQLPVRGDAFILPLAAPAGTFFTFLASGYQSGETVSSWITAASGSSTAIDPANVFLDNGGTVQVDFGSVGLADGVYTVVAQGLSSGVISTAAFKITNDYVAGPGTPRPPSSNGSVTPAQGGVGTVFQARGQNLRPDEELEYWVTEPTGVYVFFPIPLYADSQGRIGYDPAFDLEAPDDASPGVYGLHFRGKSSGVRVDIYFTLLGQAQGQPRPGSALRLIEQLVAQGVLPDPGLRLRSGQ